MAVQDKTTIKSLITSTINTNNNKEVSGLDVNTVVNNIVDSAVWYNEAQSKTNIRLATTAAGTFATSFANGQTVDGVALVTGNRILLKDQAAPAENGAYTVNASGAPTRAVDFDAADEIILGAIFYISEGTANAGRYYYLSAPTGVIVMETSQLTFTRLGVAVVSTTFNAQTTTGYTLVLADEGKTITLSNASANTLTVPTNASVPFPIGTEIVLIQKGAGQTTIDHAGVTVNSEAGDKKIAARYGSAVLVKEDTDTWYLIGSLTS